MLIWEGNFALLICLYPKPPRRRACRRSSLGRYPDLVRVPFRGIVCCSCTRMSAVTWRCGLQVCPAAAGSMLSRARCPRDRNCAVPGGAPARRRIRVILAMWGMRCCGIRPLASRKHPPMRYELSTPLPHLGCRRTLGAPLRCRWSECRLFVWLGIPSGSVCS